jgi:thiol-disulfide isomerase/thioredoxin
VVGLYPTSAYTRLLGRPAPAVAVAHWTAGADTSCNPFESFEPGRVHVLAFWATWCPRCRETLPLLAGLKQQAGLRDVAVVAVTHESPEDVRQFLAGDDEATRPAVEAARTCCIAIDPDESVHRDYMEAVDETGIPTVFIIGRDGLVEWIGHPSEIASPLRSVVEGSWDRSAFIDERRQIEPIRARMANIIERSQEKNPAGAIAEFRDFAATRQNDAKTLNEIGWLVVEFAEDKPLPAGLVSVAIDAVQRSLAIAPDDGNTLDTLAHLQRMRGDRDAAVETAKRALERPGPHVESTRRFLHELETPSSTGG